MSPTNMLCYHQEKTKCITRNPIKTRSRNNHQQKQISISKLYRKWIYSNLDHNPIRTVTQLFPVYNAKLLIRGKKKKKTEKKNAIRIMLNLEIEKINDLSR